MVEVEAGSEHRSLGRLGAACRWVQPARARRAGASEAAPEPGEARGSLQMGAARQGETSGSERGSTGAWGGSGQPADGCSPPGRDERERARQHRSLGGSGQPADGCSPPGRDERERARQHRSLGRLGAACRWVQPARARRAGASEAAPEPGEARGSLQMGAARQGETSGSGARQHRSLGRLGAACRWVQPARARRAGASEAIFDCDPRRKEMEAGVGIEPTYGAFAEPGLTTWLPRQGKATTNTR